MKITKLSYKKIEVEYKIPIVTNFKTYNRTDIILW